MWTHEGANKRESFCITLGSRSSIDRCDFVRFRDSLGFWFLIERAISDNPYKGAHCGLIKVLTSVKVSVLALKVALVGVISFDSETVSVFGS